MTTIRTSKNLQFGGEKVGPRERSASSPVIVLHLDASRDIPQWSLVGEIFRGHPITPAFRSALSQRFSIPWTAPLVESGFHELSLLSITSEISTQQTILEAASKDLIEIPTGTYQRREPVIKGKGIPVWVLAVYATKRRLTPEQISALWLGTISPEEVLAALNYAKRHPEHVEDKLADSNYAS